MDWTLLNVMWTLTAFVGCIACIRNVIEATADYLAVPHIELKGISRKNARIVAGMGIVIHSSIGLALFLFLVLGVLAITTPPPSRVLNNVLIVSFIVVQLALTTASILGNIYRKRLITNGT